MDDVVNSSLQRGEGLYFLEQELLKELKPDVIVTQDLCNVCSVDLQLVQKTVEQLSIKPNIVTLNPQKLSDVLKDIVRVGKAVGCQQQSEATVAALERRVLKAQEIAKGASKDHKPITVAFVEWLDPLFVGGHWTPEMIKMAGATHPLNMPIGEGGAGPSKRITNEALVEADCDWIIVCPCGFTIEDTKKEEDLLSTKSWWQNLRAVKEGRVTIVDGNQMFARPGPRLVDALEFLVGLLHNSPALIPADFPWTWWDTQKAATSAATEPESLSAHTKGKAGGTTTDSSSQVANGNSSSDAASMQVGKSSSSSSSSVSTSDPSVETKTAEEPVSTLEGCSDTAGQHAAEQSGEASHNSNGVMSGQQAAEQPGSVSQNATDTAKQQAVWQAGSTPQDSVGNTAGQQAAERKWGAAPFLGPEIEEAHAAAIDAGQPTYTDPATGYKVITEQNLRQQSVCCANRCRHCPFGHFKVPASRGSRINTITRPTLLKINRKDAPNSTSRLHLWTGNKSRCHGQADVAQSLNRASNSTAIDRHDAVSSSMATEAVSKLDSDQASQGTNIANEEASQAVWVAVFAQDSGKVWGNAALTLHDAMDDCLEAGHVLVAIPSCEEHRLAYSNKDADHLDTAARRLLC